MFLKKFLVQISIANVVEEALGTHEVKKGAR